MPMYIKFDGVDGESTEAGHKDWILIESFTWGLENSAGGGAGGGGGAGKASFSDLSIVCGASKASPQLALRCATGQHIKEAALHVTRRVRGREETYYKYELKNVIISSFQAASDGTSSTSDSFSFNFEKIKWDYQTRAADGSVTTSTFTWDLKRNTP